MHCVSQNFLYTYRSWSKCKFQLIIFGHFKQYYARKLKSLSLMLSLYHLGWKKIDWLHWQDHFETDTWGRTRNCRVRRVHRFILCQNYMIFPLVLYPPYFEAVYCFIVGRRRVAVARYRYCSWSQIMRLCTQIWSMVTDDTSTFNSFILIWLYSFLLLSQQTWVVFH